MIKKYIFVQHSTIQITRYINIYIWVYHRLNNNLSHFLETWNYHSIWFFVINSHTINQSNSVEEDLDAVFGYGAGALELTHDKCQ